jgi:hypothetical protein
MLRIQIRTLWVGSGRLGPDLDPSKIVRIRNTGGNHIFLVFEWSIILIHSALMLACRIFQLKLHI